MQPTATRTRRRYGWRGRTHAFAATLALCIAALCPAPPAAALEPDQIALVVNAKVPASRELADFYAQKRGIPRGRVIAVDLPFPAEEISASDYDTRVAPAVRAFLRDNGLKDKVTCLVTFWGVPLRIGRRQPSPDDNEQLALVAAELAKTRADLLQVTQQSEALASELNGAFAPKPGDDPAQLSKRAGEALTTVARAALSMQPGRQRDLAVGRMVSLFEKLMGDADAARNLAAPELKTVMPPELVTTERLERMRKQEEEWGRELAELKAKPPSPQTAAAMRTLVRDHFGLFRYNELLTVQQASFQSAETEAALDSELALLWWEAPYPRFRWQPNLLNYKVRPPPQGTPPTLMVTRLDGPTEESVDRIILASLKAERDGLQGIVTLDARGIKTNDGYGRYDTSIRRLAGLIRAKTQVRVVFDDVDGLIQPGPNAPKNVALYCGWYSLRNYIRAMQFSEGAVGFHVASSELVSLRTPNEPGWGAGLINDGVVATLGPVAEPYLQAFPPADEFFPLLMTGELTLAEVYWKTNPLTSWMNTCIGDPLYRPYKANPPMKPQDLPEELRSALAAAPVRGASPAAPAAAPSAAPAR